jgi:hypothetical protein
MTNHLRFALCFVICFIVLNSVFLALGIKGSILLVALVVLTVASYRIVALQPPHLAGYALGSGRHE